MVALLVAKDKSQEVDRKGCCEAARLRGCDAGSLVTGACRCWIDLPLIPY